MITPTLFGNGINVAVSASYGQQGVDTKITYSEAKDLIISLKNLLRLAAEEAAASAAKAMAIFDSIKDA